LPRAGFANRQADDTLLGLLFSVLETILKENELILSKIVAPNRTSQKECLYLRKIATKKFVLRNMLTVGCAG
jgi:hypothetical protein